jgi:hypothetical protein
MPVLTRNVGFISNYSPPTGPILQSAVWATEGAQASAVFTATGMGIALGDRLVAIIPYEDSGALRTFSSIPSGFVELPGSPAIDTTGAQMYAHVFSKIADAGDVAASTFTFTKSAADYQYPWFGRIANGQFVRVNARASESADAGNWRLPDSIPSTASNLLIGGGWSQSDGASQGWVDNDWIASPGTPPANRGVFYRNAVNTSLIAASDDDVAPTTTRWVSGIVEISSLVAADNFNRPDGAVGSDWTPDQGTLAIASNALTHTSAGTDSLTRYTAASFADDQEAQIDITLGASLCDGGVYVRSGGATTGYIFVWLFTGGGTYALYKNGNTFTSIGSNVTGVGTTGTRRLRIEAIGTTINCYVNDVLQITVTDSSHTSGSPGLTGWVSGGTTPILDNFTARASAPPTSLSIAQWAQDSNWFSIGSGTKTVTGLSWSSGDTIIFVGGVEDSDVTGLQTPTNANLTFSLETSQSSFGPNESGVYIWKAVAGSSQTSQTIEMVQSGTWLNAGCAAWVITGGASGTANADSNRTEAAFSKTVSAGSIVIYACMDWNATNPPGKTPLTGSGTATERRDAGDGTSYAQYLAEWVDTAAGTFSFGPSDFTSLKASHAIIEVLA